jgi:hypothetical protein
MKDVHQALHDFQWIVNNLASHPTRIAELVPFYLQPWATMMHPDKVQEVCGSPHKDYGPEDINTFFRFL